MEPVGEKPTWNSPLIHTGLPQTLRKDWQALSPSNLSASDPQAVLTSIV